MPQYLPGDMNQEPGVPLRKARRKLVDKISTSEEASLGAMPTALVYSSALAATDDREAARWAVTIARELDLPVPASPGGKKEYLRRNKEPLVDPYTGKAISMQRANSLMNMGAGLASILARPPMPKRPAVNPEEVLRYLNVADFTPEVSAEFALGMALDMDRKRTPRDLYRANVAVAAAFNEESGAWSDEEVLIYARWWAENKDTVMTRGDLVTLTTPELTEAIAERKQALRSVHDWTGREINNQALVMSSPELDRLIAARDRAISDASLLNEARNVLNQVEAPTFADRAVTWVSKNILDPTFKAGQRIYTEVATPFAYAGEWVTALPPGGKDFNDALANTQRLRSNLIQRINEGGSIGELYVEETGIPPWVGAGFDFAVGWVFDPLIIGGAVLSTVRAAKLAPGLVRVPGIVGAGANRLLRNPHIFEWSVKNFSEGSVSRSLLKAAYEGTDEVPLLQRVDRLATHYEARSPLEYRFMVEARKRLLEKYPRINDRARAEWAEIMRAHFGVRPRAGSLAEEVVRARQGLAVNAEEALLHAKTTRIAGRTYREGPGGVMMPESQARAAIEEVIEQSTVPLTLRAEVPHRLIGTGAKRGAMALRESRLGNTSVARRLRAGFNPNPGNVFRLADDPEKYLFRRGVRWREFSESELRGFQARAAEIRNSGVSVERRLVDLRDEIDSLALKRIAQRHGVPDDVSAELIREINRLTRRADQGQVFGAIEQGAGTRIRSKPVMEAQLANESFSADPVLLRKAMNRYQGTIRDYVRAATNNMGAGITPEALEGIARLAHQGTDFGKLIAHDMIRTWKFMVVPRPAYIGRVILLDEGSRFLATTNSVLDRLMAQELKLGIGPAKFDLGRRLDARGVGRIEVPVGNKTVTLPRIGAQDYEPLANQLFRAEDMLDDAMRHALAGDAASKASGHYGVIYPESSEYAALWERVLNKQFGNSPAGIAAMESVALGNDVKITTQRLKAWASREGFINTRSRIGLREEDIAEWADDLAKMAHGYTGSNPAVANAVLARAVKRDMISLIPEEARGPIHGPLLDRLTAATGTQNNMRRYVDNWYNLWVRHPESVLNRQPYYRYWKRRASESYLRMLDSQGYQKFTVREVVNRRPFISTIGPADAQELRRLANLSDRQFLDEVLEKQGGFVGRMEIRDVYAGPRAEALPREISQFEGGAKWYGVPERPDMTPPIADASPSSLGTTAQGTAKDLGKGVWRYGDTEDLSYTYAVWDGDELQAYMRIPRYEAGYNQVNIEADSIIIRARPGGASKGATARLGDAAMRDVGAEVTVNALLRGNIPLSRKGALLVHRRLKALVTANEETLTKVRQMKKVYTPQTEAAIDQASREFALSQLNKIMFDFTENTRIGEMLATVLPFTQPWMEAYAVWGHIFVHRNPALFGYINQLGRLGLDSGFVRRDEDGVLTVPWSWHSDVVGLLPWFNQLPEGAGMSAPLSSLNLFFSQTGDVAGIPIPMPGVAPWVGWPLKNFFAETQNPFLTSYLFQHGFGTPIVPLWAERAARVVFPDAFSDDRLDSAAMDFLKWYEVSGTDRYVNKQGEVVRYTAEQLQERALADARRVQGLLGVTSFFSLTAGKFEFPEEYRDLEAELDALIDAVGPSEAFNQFHERHPDLDLFTVGKTVTTTLLGDQQAPRLPASQYADQLLARPGFREFAAQYPAWAIALILSKDEEFDIGVFGKQVHDGSVRYRSIEEFLLAGQSTGFWESIDALSSWYYPKRENLEAQGLDTENPKFQDNERARRQQLYQIWLRYPAKAEAEGIKPVETTSGAQVPEATWESLGAQPPPTIVYAQVRRILEMDSVAEFPAIQGLKAYMLLRDPIEEEMIRLGIDSIEDSAAVRLGLTERFERGTTEILASFPDAEQLIDTFFRNDLTSTRVSPVDRVRERDPERYQQFESFDTRLEALNDKASGVNTTDQRNRVYALMRDHINDSYAKGESWKMKLWYKNKSASGRQQYLETLQGRPPVFYSRFDWDLMGVDLTNKAQEWLTAMETTRSYISGRIEQELRGGDEFLSGNAYESLDAWVKGHLGKDRSFDQAVEGMRTWGWALWQPEAGYVNQKGKAGWAWRYLRDLVTDVNQQAIQIGLHGPDSFDSADFKQGYVEARDALLLHINWLRSQSSAFDEQVDDFQRSVLRGDPILEWLMPDTYYPLGVTGD